MTNYFDDAERDAEWWRAVAHGGDKPTVEQRQIQLAFEHYVDAFIADLDRRMHLAREGIIPYGERD